MSDERCSVCDRVADECDRFTKHPWLTAGDVRDLLPTHSLYRAWEACDANRVDWRARCLKAEQEAAALRKERGEWGLLCESAEFKVADRDQQLAELRSQIAALRAVAEVVADSEPDDRLGGLKVYGVQTQYLQDAARDAMNCLAPNLDRAAIEAEVIEQVAAWLYQARRDDRCSSGLLDEFCAGAWRKP